MQLWHDLTIAEQRRYDHIFRSIVNPITLTAEEFVLLAQWLFVSDHYTVQSIAPCVGSGHDVVLRAPDATLELLRLYHANPPFISIYSLQETARDGGYIKIRIYTLGTFTPSQLKVQNELPMLLEFRDGNKVAARLEDTRRVLQAQHNRQNLKPEPPLAQFGKQASKQNTLDDELRVVNRTPVYITRPRRNQTFARVMLVILSSLVIIISSFLSHIVYKNETQRIIAIVLTELYIPPLPLPPNYFGMPPQQPFFLTSEAAQTKEWLTVTSSHYARTPTTTRTPTRRP